MDIIPHWLPTHCIPTMFSLLGHISKGKKNQTNQTAPPPPYHKQLIATLKLSLTMAPWLMNLDINYSS